MGLLEQKVKHDEKYVLIIYFGLIIPNMSMSMCYVCSRNISMRCLGNPGVDPGKVIKMETTLRVNILHFSF